LTIQKNSREEIRVEPTEYKGQSLVSIRAWAKTYDGRGYIPTKKGLTVSPGVAKSLSEAIQQVVSG
jgi:hypothetical protein